MKKITFLLFSLMSFAFANAQFTSMAIVGDGAGGWPTGAAGEVDVNQMTSTDGINWFIDNLVTSAGSVKLRANNSWANNWGGTTFPNGTGVFDGPVNITTGVGIYDVTFNSTTLAYSFVAQNLYPIISLVGPGVVGGSWDMDTDMGTTDGVHYAKYGVDLFGAVKFRQDHTWEPNNWAPLTFPSGVAVLGDPGSATVPEGTYNVFFNRTTLEYSFSYPKIAIVGSATPQGWPSDPQVDLHELTSTDGITYTLGSITLSTGAAKFRQDNNWAVQWGGDGGFPTGTGSQGGTDIPVVAGTYSVTLNTVTGAYTFAAPTSGTEAFGTASLKVYPNPTSNVWNFSSANEKIERIQITDILGKTVVSATPAGNEATVDASGLTSGIYFATIATNGATSTIKIVRN